MIWNAVIFGPHDTPFEDGTFKLTIEFTEEYPNKPPTVRFVSKVFHPNVYADGGICLDILQNRWSPTYDVSAILTSIQVNSLCSMFELIDFIILNVLPFALLSSSWWMTNLLCFGCIFRSLWTESESGRKLFPLVNLLESALSFFWFGSSSLNDRRIRWSTWKPYSLTGYDVETVLFYWYTCNPSMFIIMFIKKVHKIRRLPTFKLNSSLSFQARVHISQNL